MEPNQQELRQQERRQQERRQQERREQEIRQEELRQEELRQEEEEARQEERRQEELRQQEVRQQLRQQALRPETPNASTSAGESSEPGTSGIRSGIRKRKAPHEYSTNPNTMRVRERNAKLSPYQLAVERAKSNDLKAVSTAWRERGDTEAFQRASPAEKEKIIAETEEEVMIRRRRKGIDADTKILALNLQFSEDERSPGLSSGGLAGTTGAGKGKSVPAMAPPGYQPFPAQPLPHLMGRGKKPAFPGAGPATSAGRASLSEDDAAGPVLERQDYPMMDRADAEFGAAIEDFKNLQADGDRRSAEERLYIMTQLRSLTGAVTDLGQKLEQLMALLQQPAGRQEAAPLQHQHQHVSAQQQQQQQHPSVQQHDPSVYGNHPSGPHTYPLPPIQGSSAHQSTHQPWRCYTTALSKFANDKFADDGDNY